MVKNCCEVCGKTTSLHVHHVDENPLNNSTSNLMTLCSQCHREAHSKHFSAPMVRITCRHCEKPAMKNSLCWTHNTRYQKYGDPLMTKKKIGSDWYLVREHGL
ncbi:HNH endonuclease [Nitrosomonas communis]|uniref:HNH endonuclease n=1 Tax=Nitrosomonas communis TaxID=44574 RepID=UPI0034E96002